MKSASRLAWFLSITVLCADGYAQLLPKDWQKAVVMFESKTVVEGQPQYEGLGTAFIVGRKDPAEDRRNAYLITAKHVLTVLLSSRGEISFRVDTKDGKIARLPLRLASAKAVQGRLLVGLGKGEKEQSWVSHQEYDVAAIEISTLGVPDNSDFRIFDSELLASKEKYESLGLAEGDATFVIVYDADFGARLLRSGMISRMLPGGTFYMEAVNFPGDSGSPVVLKPSISRKPGVIEPLQPLILGLVSDVLRRLAPIAKFNERRDLLFPQSMNLSVVQPSYAVLELLSPSR